MKPIIRKATKADLTAILGLVVELAVYEKEPEAVTAKLRDYTQAYEDGLISAHVATIDEVVVGMALYYDTFSTWKGKMLYLEDFYVKSEFRSLGIGQLLFNAFIETAKLRACKMVKWEVIDWNDRAVQFYIDNGATIDKQWWNAKIIFD